ncbi:uncharacterized protein BT62DRAFT_441885 [Guyanagaster necrorhizus]|uniref:Yeast cell wall synthesis Kre9/Knh1-like N-terminal domain-containing protein n=1 Tax=Guyanagaster necrorhizus TaxID=856835 RepID=A0A9P7W5I4_9AGAR|nr:uncharacterized protein BT62DRAFT_441885 [Guyanagaster necrorhizus MCA 3950]KAG7451676.1 hypothetical protein BT62DRAFT_441885 [Guyanagaster necrorhizus MCA 3950]
MFSKSSAFVLFGLTTSVLATVYITDPISSTVWNAGNNVTVSWEDDGTSPTLEEFGAAKFAIAVGNSQEQTTLQVIAENVNVATVSSLQFIPSANIGATSNEYFIRVDSNDLKDANNSAIPALSFSAKFTIDGMSGSFNSSVQAEIDGQSTAPLAGSSTSASSSASANKATSASTTKAASVSTTATVKASSSGTGTKASSAASSSSTGNSAVVVTANNSKMWLSAVLAAAFSFAVC